jgi:peptidoglycan DL-endopeptidase CwlO
VRGVVPHAGAEFGRAREYGRHVGTRLAGTRARLGRGVAVAAGLIAMGGLAGIAVNAGAASEPTVAQVQTKVDQLTTQFDKVSEQLDQVGEQLGSAQQQLKQVSAKYKQVDALFLAAQQTVAQIAASAFEDTGSDTVAGVLTAGNPQVVLQQGALLLELSSSRDDQTEQLLADASQLAGVQQELQRTETGVATLKSELTSRRDYLKRLIATEQATLDSLTFQQQEQVQTGTVGAGGTGAGGSKSTTPTPTYTGPTGTEADTAVAFAFSQLGCPYVYGGTGPCPLGYDCSGLVQAAWAAAGVDIPRDTYSQWAALPHIPMSDLQPGDLIYYNGIGHVAMYVGNGEIIDAPLPGENVEEIPMSTPWYADNEDGAVSP